MHSSVVLIGIGGASCSGKTTLAKHLHKILPNSFIVHQDDFTPPQSQIPIHPIHNIQDWDAAPGAIDWQRFVDFLRQVKATGVIPNSHYSHDHLNEQEDVPISDECAQKWASVLGSRKDGTTWIIIDGFLLFWHPEVVQQLDVKFFLRVPHDVLEQRRKRRNGYYMADQSDPEGSFWKDPPLYWDQIVYPAYVDAHWHLFENGDVERGKVAGGGERTKRKKKDDGKIRRSPLNATFWNEFRFDDTFIRTNDHDANTWIQERGEKILTAFTHPHKNSDEFKGFVKERKRGIDTWTLNTLISTDASYDRKTHQASTAAIVYMNGQIVLKKGDLCSAGNSYEAEIQGLERAIILACSRAKGEVTIICDNEEALKDILALSIHPMQMCSIRARDALDLWLDKDDSNIMRFAWCPGHCGIQANEEADRKAKRVMREADPIERENYWKYRTMGKTLARIKELAEKERKKEYKRSSNWMRVKIKGKNLDSGVRGKKRKKIVRTLKDEFHKCDEAWNENEQYARLSRVLSNHAPTGEYRTRFFTNENAQCDDEGETQTRTHILHVCCRYSSISPLFLSTDKESLQTLARFLAQNPTAFTFEDAPSDLKPP